MWFMHVCREKYNQNCFGRKHSHCNVVIAAVHFVAVSNRKMAFNEAEGSVTKVGVIGARLHDPAERNECSHWCGVSNPNWLYKIFCWRRVGVIRDVGNVPIRAEGL